MAVRDGARVRRRSRARHQPVRHPRRHHPPAPPEPEPERPAQPEVEARQPRPELAQPHNHQHLLLPEELAGAAALQHQVFRARLPEPRAEDLGGRPASCT